VVQEKPALILVLTYMTFFKRIYHFCKLDFKFLNLLQQNLHIYMPNEAASKVLFKTGIYYFNVSAFKI